MLGEVNDAESFVLLRFSTYDDTNRSIAPCSGDGPPVDEQSVEYGVLVAVECVATTGTPTRQSRPCTVHLVNAPVAMPLAVLGLTHTNAVGSTRRHAQSSVCCSVRIQSMSAYSTATSLPYSTCYKSRWPFRTAFHTRPIRVVPVEDSTTKNSAPASVQRSSRGHNRTLKPNTPTVSSSHTPKPERSITPRRRTLHSRT